MGATMTRRRPAGQRREALNRANEVRAGAAVLKRELAAGLSLSAALEDERAQAMRIGRLLLALPQWGPISTRKFLGGLLVGEHRRVRDLTARQRELVVRRAAVRGVAR